MTYTQLLEAIIAGQPPDINKLTQDDFFEIFLDDSVTDKKLGQLLKVNPNRINNLRRKYEITKAKSFKYAVFHLRSCDSYTFNRLTKNYLFKNSSDKIVKATVDFILLNSPLADLHNSNVLIQNDIIAIRHHMLKRVAFIMKLVADDNWITLFALSEAKNLSDECDTKVPKPDDGGIIPELVENIEKLFDEMEHH